jgi:hypothetical protein
MIKKVVPLILTFGFIACDAEGEESTADMNSNADSAIVNEIEIPPYSEEWLIVFDKVQIEDSVLVELDSVYIIKADYEDEKYALSGDDISQLTENR